MKTLKEVVDNIRHFDWNDDVYDCKEVMNGFADDIESAVSYDCACCNLLVEDRKCINRLKLDNEILRKWIRKLCDVKERNIKCEECFNMICPLCKKKYEEITHTDVKLNSSGHEVHSYVLTMHNSFTDEDTEYKTFATSEEEAMNKAEDIFDSDWCIRDIEEVKEDVYY